MIAAVNSHLSETVLWCRNPCKRPPIFKKNYKRIITSIFQLCCVWKALLHIGAIQPSDQNSIKSACNIIPRVWSYSPLSET